MKKKSKGTEFNAEVSTPNLRVELSYISLMVWFIIYCPSLMTSLPKDISGGSFIPRHEG